MTSYQDAGVNIEDGDELVRRIKPFAAKTMRKEVLSGVGGFASLCALPSGFREPILVSGTDGVGTKLKVAIRAGRHDTIGQDLVAMCVNDIVTSGAEPLFFLDYFATAKLDVNMAESVIRGIAKGCELAGCALVGGETAEMPGMYAAGDYDLAGFAVGVVEKDQRIDGTKVQAGDALVAIASSGLHSNGYSLARKVLFEKCGYDLDHQFDQLPGTLGDALLTPTRIYAKALKKVFAGHSVHAAAHVTGGGIVLNLPRVLPEWAQAELLAWSVPPIFQILRAEGNIPTVEMERTFNLGIGMVLVVAPGDAEAVVETLNAEDESAWVAGHIRKRPEGGPSVNMPALFS